MYHNSLGYISYIQLTDEKDVEMCTPEASSPFPVDHDETAFGADLEERRQEIANLLNSDPEAALARILPEASAPGTPIP